ncbi:hypothetical protein [Pseudonocardia sp. H11422]|uniref:hypothetical protein n=1 Tax=Pseudonocardia sp. H11422 TaxID=2835866 RepID=UPI001BDD2BE1|nr:hypothetical protein [Pseudonocardia sp. H11422]
MYLLRSRGLLHGLASGTNWVLRDESMHMEFALDVVSTVREEEPDLVDEDFSYLEHVAERGLTQPGFAPAYGSAIPFGFLELQDVQEAVQLPRTSRGHHR